MGQQGVGSAISLAAGIAAAAAVIILSQGTATPLVTMIAFSAGSVAAGLIYNSFASPKAASSQDASAQQLQIANASESYPVPVIFGTQRLAGNYLRYEKDYFESKKIVADSEASGGKGATAQSSSGQVIGFRYFLSWEYGLCMGSVEYVHKVVSNPGERVVFNDEDGRALNEPNGEEIHLESGDKEEEGEIVLYRGDKDTNRAGGTNDPYDGDGMNYQHICWALFKRKFEIGRSPAPP